MKLIDNIEALRLNNILVFDDFLNTTECNELLAHLDAACWEKSKLARIEGHGGYIEFHSPTRTNEVCHYSKLTEGPRNMVNMITNKLAAINGIDKSKMEAWQFNKYNLGNKFDFHNDCGCWQNSPTGEREKTIMLYLLSPLQGGETFFRAINHYISPIAGRLVIWENLLPNGNCNYAMIHGGLPVTEGVKITLNTWQRQKSFT